VVFIIAKNSSFNGQHGALIKKYLWFRFVLFSAVFFFLDLITKLLFKKDSFQTTGNFVDISFTKNTGTMWGLFSSITAINIFFVVLSLLMLVVVVFLLKRYLSKRTSLSFALIFAGVLGNLVDRLFRGFGVDWINFHFWPVFNIADSAIVLGVILSVYFLFKDEF